MTVLPTFSDLPFVSPLAKTLSELPADQQAQAARTWVGLGEISGRALLHVRGSDAETALSQAVMKIGDVAAVENGLLARLRRDEFVLLTPEGRSTLDRLTEMIGAQRVTLTDITHGRSGLLLVGAHAADVLAKVCALDFADTRFPTLHAAQTSLAKVRTLILRSDIGGTPAYGLFVDRSQAAYVWDVVYDAAQEFGGIALSKTGLDSLRRASSW